MVAQVARLVRRFEQHVGAVDVSLDEGVGAHDAAVDVRLGGKVDDGIGMSCVRRAETTAAASQMSPHDERSWLPAAPAHPAEVSAAAR